MRQRSTTYAAADLSQRLRPGGRDKRLRTLTRIWSDDGPDRGLRADRRHSRPPRWSAATGRSTGCACRASTPARASPRCSATTDNGRWLIAPAGEVRRVAAPLPRRHAGARDRVRDRRRASVRVDRLHAAARARSRTWSGSSRASAAGCAMRMELVIRFDYGSIVPWVRRRRRRAASRSPGPTRSCCAPRSPTRGRGPDARSPSSTVAAGRAGPVRAHLVPVARAAARRIDRRARARATPSAGGASGRARCTYEGAWREAVLRSLITLKALTYAPDRRDRRRADDLAARAARRRAQLGLPLLLAPRRDVHALRADAAPATSTRRAPGATGCCARSPATPDELQIMYGVAGERRLTELELAWLAGYEGSRPVRVGNAASEQFQLDVYGEVIDALYQRARQAASRPTTTRGACSGELLEFLEPAGASPTRASGRSAARARHFTHSKVMAWVAFDRAVKTVEQLRPRRPGRPLAGAAGDDPRRGLREGYDPERGAFIQYYGSDRLDASLLMIPLVGFLPATDPRVVGTVAAIERELCATASSLRYRADASADVDGLPAGRGRVPALLVLARRRPRAASGASDEAARAVRAPARVCATTSACSPRSTTRSAGGWSATSRRRSRTSASSTPRSPLALAASARRRRDATRRECPSARPCLDPRTRARTPRRGPSRCRRRAPRRRRPAPRRARRC